MCTVEEFPILRLHVVCSQTDNNPLTYVLTAPNLDVTGHRWVGVLSSFEFTLEYQKGVGNGATHTLSYVPICHNHKMVQSLLESTIVGERLRPVRNY